MGAYATKEMLVYAGFTVDALNTLVTFPLFAYNGPKWVLSAIMPTGTKEKEEDDKALEDVNRRSFQALWEIFMICYEGYTGFTVSTLVCIYKVPETIPIFAYSLFALYLYKLQYLLNKSSSMESVKDDDYKKVEAKGKLASVLFFFLPCYGGYCGMHAFEYFGKK